MKIYIYLLLANLCVSVSSLSAESVFNDKFYIPSDNLVTWICENGHYVSPSQGNECPKCGGKNRKG